MATPIRFRVSAQGFSLIEMMVTVAIIALLTSIAIPSYKKYQARARQSEARVGLGSIFTAEKSFLASQSYQSACLAALGFSPMEANRYYTVGFDAAFGGYDVPYESPSLCPGMCGLRTNHIQYKSRDFICNDEEGQTFFSANVSADDSGGGVPTVRNDLTNGSTFVCKKGFTALAAGRVGFEAIDYWMIDESKAIFNLGGAPDASWLTMVAASPPQCL